jgi:hypothetical protein
MEHEGFVEIDTECVLSPLYIEGAVGVRRGFHAGLSERERDASVNLDKRRGLANLDEIEIGGALPVEGDLDGGVVRSPIQWRTEIKILSERVRQKAELLRGALLSQQAEWKQQGEEC